MIPVRDKLKMLINEGLVINRGSRDLRTKESLDSLIRQYRLWVFDLKKSMQVYASNLDSTIVSYFFQGDELLPEQPMTIMVNPWEPRGKEITSYILDSTNEKLDKLRALLSGRGSVKPKIYISDRYVIYLDKAKRDDETYDIKGKRLKLVFALSDGRRPGKELGRAYSKGIHKLNEEIQDINRLFRDELSLAGDLIIHLPTGGYDLNHEDYIFDFTNE